jgi:hypothetical protein
VNLGEYLVLFTDFFLVCYRLILRLLNNGASNVESTYGRISSENGYTQDGRKDWAGSCVGEMSWNSRRGSEENHEKSPIIVGIRTESETLTLCSLTLSVR